MAGKNQTQSPRREPLFVGPYSGRHKETFIRAVEGHRAFLLAVEEIHLKGTGGSDNKLPALSMGMATAVFACRHIIDIKHTPDVKWHMLFAINIGKVAAWVFLLRQL